MDFNCNFILRTDTSDQGVVGKLPVAYAIRKLLPREQNYSAIQKERLVIEWGMEKLRRYLFGNDCLLEADHKTLPYLQNAKVLNPKIIRWALKPYRFRIVAT